jgi:hypothetical protein
MKSFKAAKKSDIYKTLLRIGLTDITTERQKKNKTLALYDTETHAKYTFTASGYYRRERAAEKNMYKDQIIYQLNPREDRWGSKTTVLFPGKYEKMMTLALANIYSFRKSIAQENKKIEIEWAMEKMQQVLLTIS